MLSGCAAQSYTSADVVVGFPPNRRAIVVSDAKELKRLADAIPGFGNESWGTHGIAMAWHPWINITFHRKDGGHVLVESNGDEVWQDEFGNIGPADALVAEVKQLIDNTKPAPTAP